MLPESLTLPARPNPISPIGPIFRLYEGLVATIPLDPLSGLGGKLLYAGEIGSQGNPLLYAANIAGAATLAASADPAAMRNAMREGVIDFFVNSLEEALRILKNEIRKRQTVSVGVGIAPVRLVEQMLDRGVLPDLLPPASSQSRGLTPDQEEQLRAQGARQIGEAETFERPFVVWTVEPQPARWLPRLDACVYAVIPQEDLLRRRWLHLAPRYLGRVAQRGRGVALSIGETEEMRVRVREILGQPEATALQVTIDDEPVLL